jgi:hypothetical protein
MRPYATRAPGTSLKARITCQVAFVPGFPSVVLLLLAVKFDGRNICGNADNSSRRVRCRKAGNPTKVAVPAYRLRVWRPLRTSIAPGKWQMAMSNLRSKLGAKLCRLSPVACLLSPVSCLLSPVSCLLSPFSFLLHHSSSF